MSDQSRLDAGTRLADDLRRIRERRDLTLGDLNAETKIPRALLESFEDRALFDHAQFNRVYLRSFVRTYASSIGVEPERAAEALERAFEGEYDGSLAVEYLGEAPRTLEPPAEDVPAAARAERPPRAPEEREPRPRAARPVEEASIREEKTAEEEKNEHWAATSPPSRKPRPRPEQSPRKRAVRRRSGASWPLILGGLIGVAVLIWIIVSVAGSGERPVDEQPDDLTAGVEAEDEFEEPDAPPIEIPTLGDSLVVFVVAAQDKVDPIRVTVDDDLRRPYWIDEGDSMRFAAATRIVFEERLDVVQLNLQGHYYPTASRDDRGRIVITRDAAESFFESLGR